MSEHEGKRDWRGWLVTASGLATSVVCALAVTVVDWLTGFNLFTLMVLFVFPAGALLVGFVAASGYYLASKRFDVPPSKGLLLQMVGVAALTQFLIYYIQYLSVANLNGSLDFREYLDTALTSARYRMQLMHHEYAPRGEVGSLGRWLAGIQLLGFCMGGLWVWIKLRANPYCAACGRYLAPLAAWERVFWDGGVLTTFSEQLFGHRPDSPQFAELMRQPDERQRVRGVYRLGLKLYGCTSCLSQLLVKSVAVNNGRDWRETPDGARQLHLSRGVDARRAFRRG